MLNLKTHSFELEKIENAIEEEKFEYECAFKEEEVDMKIIFLPNECEIYLRFTPIDCNREIRKVRKLFANNISARLEDFYKDLENY